jgi:hypothetical protein
MFVSWATGQAPEYESFGPDTPQTRDMMSAPGVERALTYFYTKNSIGSINQQQSVTNYPAGFGLPGVFAAGFNPSQQFVGNYRVDLYPNASGNISVQLTNTTSMSSFLYHIYPNSWNLPNGFPGGNSTQVYYWVTPNQNILSPSRRSGPGAGSSW